MKTVRRLLWAALFAGSVGPLAAQIPIATPQHMAPPETAPAPLPVPSPTPILPSNVSAINNSCSAPTCDPCPPKVCGPLIKRTPICLPKVVCAPAVSCPPAPVCKPVCPAPAPEPRACTTCPTPGHNYGAAPSRPAYGAAPAMTTIQVPYTYMVPVPTFAMMPHTTYGAAPVSYGAAPMVYGAAPVAYGAAPVAYGAPPPQVTYGAAPVVAAPAPVYGAAPESDCCKKELPALKEKVAKLTAEMEQVKTAAKTHFELTTETVKQIVSINEKLKIAEENNSKLFEKK